MFENDEQSPPSTSQSTVSFVLHGESNPRTFKNHDEFLDFCITESNLWRNFIDNFSSSWNRISHQGNQDLDSFYNIYKEFIHEIVKICADLKSIDRNKDFEIFTNSIDKLKSKFASDLFLSSDSLGGNFILAKEKGRESRRKNYVTDFIILIIWLGKDVDITIGSSGIPINFTRLSKAIALYKQSSRNALLDAYEASKISNEINSKIIKQASENENSLADIRKRHNNEFSIISESFKKFATEARQKIDSKYEEIENFKIAKEDLLNKMVEEKEKSFQNIEMTFKEHMTLKAPVDYWLEKNKSHSKSSRARLWFLIILVIIGIIASLYLLYIIFPIIENTKNAGTSLSIAAMIAIPSILYANLVKLANRSYQNHIHQANDAEQRSVLVKTFLAFTNENSQSIQQGERILALHALFRGSAFSESPDDTPPINVLDALIQSLKPKSGP